MNRHSETDGDMLQSPQFGFQVAEAGSGDADAVAAGVREAVTATGGSSYGELEAGGYAGCGSGQHGGDGNRSGVGFKDAPRSPVQLPVPGYGLP